MCLTSAKTVVSNSNFSGTEVCLLLRGGLILKEMVFYSAKQVSFFQNQQKDVKGLVT